METLCMVLAGGEGRRLLTLTSHRAKPVVLFGGMYRVIDFVLSNVINSGIKDIGLLMQYQPDSMLKHMAFAWSLDRALARIDILLPLSSNSRYESPADAVFKRSDYILTHNPQYVLIVPGDYISLIDFRQIIDSHIDSGADLTIAGTHVEKHRAPHFGMMETDQDGNLTKYTEKPQHEVDTTFASMGIYVFRTNTLIRQLHAEKERCLNKPMSFTYGIIPAMLGRHKVVAHEFSGYWRDVGTIDSYLEANLELIKIMPQLDLYDTDHPIRSRLRFEPPTKINDTGYVKNSIITQGSIIEGHVERSIIFPHVHIGEGARVCDSIIMPNNYIGTGATISRTIIDTTSRAQKFPGKPNIGPHCTIGGYGDAPPNSDYPLDLNTSITIISMESDIPPHTTIGRNCIIFPDTKKGDFGDKLDIPDGHNIRPSIRKYCDL